MYIYSVYDICSWQPTKVNIFIYLSLNESVETTQQIPIANKIMTVTEMIFMNVFWYAASVLKNG